MISIEDDVAKFVEVDSESDLLNPRKYPLFSVGLSENIQKFIIIPRQDFDRIVAGVDESDREVVWMFHTMRCGSTLWSQIFYSLPEWDVISESITLCYSVFHGRQECDLEQFSKTVCYENMVEAWIKMYIRRFPKGHKIFWKAFPMDHHIIPILNKHFPRHKILFSYRDALASGKSYYRAFESIPLSVIGVKVLNRISDSQPKGIFRHMWLWYTNGYKGKLCFQTICSVMPGTGFMEWYILLWAATITMMKEFSDCGISIKYLKYEDLVANPAIEIRKLFKQLGIHEDFLEQAQLAMAHDSQDGMFLSLENRKKNKQWTRTDESMRKCNTILKAFNLPSLDKPIDLTDNI